MLLQFYFRPPEMGKTVFDPVPSEKATVQSEILDLGFHNSLLQHDM